MYCGGCFKELYRHHAGAEAECTLFFADVRGSTAIAESMAPNAYRESNQGSERSSTTAGCLGTLAPRITEDALHVDWQQRADCHTGPRDQTPIDGERRGQIRAWVGPKPASWYRIPDSQ
jgi:hypothetical protein